jgi:tetratricopeptide (TPR) repeat protein
MAGEHKKAETMLLEMLEKEPGKNTTLMMLGLVYTHMKDYDKALEALLKRSVGQNTNWLVAFNYYKMGEVEKAWDVMNYMLQLPEERSAPSSLIAITYMGLGEFEKALDYMEYGLETNDFWGIWLEQSWADPLKDNPRYIEIMETYQEIINRPYDQSQQ